MEYLLEGRLWETRSVNMDHCRLHLYTVLRIQYHQKKSSTHILTLIFIIVQLSLAHPLTCPRYNTECTGLQDCDYILITVKCLNTGSLELFPSCTYSIGAEEVAQQLSTQTLKKDGKELTFIPILMSFLNSFQLLSSVCRMESEMLK